MYLRRLLKKTTKKTFKKTTGEDYLRSYIFLRQYVEKGGGI
jgi:hypothetical protein